MNTTSACRIASVLFATVELLLGAGPVHAQCIDYRNYLHWEGGLDLEDPALDVAVKDHFAYVTDDYSGVNVIDIANPAQPKERGVYDSNGSASDVAIVGSLAYVADVSSGLHIVNVANRGSVPNLPVLTTLHGKFKAMVDGAKARREASIALALLDAAIRKLDEQVTSILIVDDMKDQRTIASAMLNRLGYRVVTASSGEQER